MADFTEIADRVWSARYDWFDVNVALVGGSRGLLLVDTHGSWRAATEVVDDVRRLGAGEVVEVVNTHGHFDHCFGNDTVLRAWPGVPIRATEAGARNTVTAGERIQAAYAADPAGADARAAEIAETVIVPADHTFSSATALDLGDRLVELVHPGRGHTDGDLVVTVPDADVLLAGDLVEQSGPPMFGEDCFPMDWPATLDLVLQLLGASTVVLPGHGAPVDRSFVSDQRDLVGAVAETIRDGRTQGAPVDAWLREADWPMETEALRHAVTRGYDQLPPATRRLPMA